jgi:hypothetical protein
MKKTHDMAAGRDALDSLVESMPKDITEWNEADTRHRFIDLLIHDVLGWERAETKVERHHGGEYTWWRIHRLRAGHSPTDSY